MNKKTRINKPLSGSLANVLTEFYIPDLTKNVPHILKVKVAINKMIVQYFKSALFSRTKTQWSNAVKQNHGINDTFSTGSQNQKPPHPSS